MRSRRRRGDDRRMAVDKATARRKAPRNVVATRAGVAGAAAKATAAGVVVVALAFGLWKVRSIIILLLLALTFAAAIRPGVEWLRRRRVPESLAILFFFVLGLGTISLFFWLLVHPEIHQVEHALNEAGHRT